MALGFSMIRCVNLRKAFDDAPTLFKGLDLEFTDTGLFLLMGESGCGKTTLLNILMGLVAPDSGEVVLSSIDKEDIDYLTQDPFFAGFLTVSENLHLISDNTESIRGVLEKVGLVDKYASTVSTLSGGERQRLAIARSLLKGSRVLLLDEPTAALDEENRISVYGLLKTLSTEVLIVCATHDVRAIDYADIVYVYRDGQFVTSGSQMSMEKSSRRTSEEHKNVTHTLQKGSNPTPALKVAIKKWYKDRMKDRLTEVWLIVCLTLAFLILAAADFPQRKVEQTEKNMYHINMQVLNVPKGVAIEEVLKKVKYEEAILNYMDNYPDGMITKTDKEQFTLENKSSYDYRMYVLPIKEELFKLKDKILYGEYVKDKYDILLPYGAAYYLTNGDPAKAVGMKVSHEVFDTGKVQFTVTGVLDKFSKADVYYLHGGRLSVHPWNEDAPDAEFDLFFASTLAVQDLEADPAFYGNNGRFYTIYFASYNDFLKGRSVLEQYSKEGSLKLAISPVPGKDGMEILSMVLLPFAALIGALTIVLFMVVHHLRMKYNGSFLSLLTYSGYSKSQIIGELIKIIMLDLIKKVIVSMAIMFVITIAVNAWNVRTLSYSSMIFTYNPLLIGLFVIGVLMIGFIMCLSVRRVYSESWYEGMIKQRDLI